MKNLLTITFIFFSFFYFGCDSDSPLSDVDLKDPSVLTAKLFVSKLDLVEGISRTMKLTFYDKYSNYVTLKNGYVKVNGFNVNIDSSSGEGKFYNILKAIGGQLKKNTTYNFEVVLGGAQDNPVNFSFKTLSADLTSLDIPLSHSKTKDLRVKWNEYSSTQKYEMELTIFYSEFGTPKTFVYNILIPADSAAIGAYTLNKSYFQDRSFTNKAKIELKTYKKEKISNFAENSEALCEYIITREVNITN